MGWDIKAVLKKCFSSKWSCAGQRLEPPFLEVLSCPRRQHHEGHQRTACVTGAPDTSTPARGARGDKEGAQEGRVLGGALTPPVGEGACNALVLSAGRGCQPPKSCDAHSFPGSGHRVLPSHRSVGSPGVMTRAEATQCTDWEAVGEQEVALSKPHGPTTMERPPSASLTHAHSPPPQYIRPPLSKESCVERTQERQEAAAQGTWGLSPARNFKTSSEGLPGGAVDQSPPVNAGDTGSIPGLGRAHMLRNH